MRHPNVVYVFSDQHRAEATGFNGNADVLTPNLDKLREESIHFATAVSTVPVCSPYRASFLTGQFPLTHGVFVNDVHLRHDAPSIADAYRTAGYDTAYIGKWHVNGRGRSAFISPSDRQGFGVWKAQECTHDYRHSRYFADEGNGAADSTTALTWDGYDAEAQTRSAIAYLQSRRNQLRPFFLVLSWGPPHNPYDTAPERFQALYRDQAVALRPNVPEGMCAQAEVELRGYYAHVTALDHCLGDLWQALKTEGLENDTLLVYTSDHGDMLYSQGQVRKQRPWDESIRVPFLLHYPGRLGRMPRDVTAPLGSPDIMPTLLALSDVDVAASVEGSNWAPHLDSGAPPPNQAALIACIHPFGEYARSEGGREYRGIRTDRYTYVRDLAGPWLLYDNLRDPYQRQNLVNQPATASLQAQLEAELGRQLEERDDEFLPGEAYLAKWGYTVDETGTVPY